MRPDVASLAELHSYQEAHVRWLGAHGIRLHCDVETLTAVSSIPDLDLSAADSSQSALLGAVLGSLQRLAAMRSLIQGPRSALRAYEAAVTTATEDHAAYLRKHRVSIEAAHDDSGVEALRPQLMEAGKRLRTLTKGLSMYQSAQVAKHAKFSATFRKEVHQLDRYLALSEWIKVQVSTLEAVLTEFEASISGTAEAMASVVDLPEARVWGASMGKLKAAIKDAGGTNADIAQLFPSKSAPESQREVNRQQIRRAKSRR
ncbi:MAG: hypothetical protein SFV15_15465 [Polyangiaceae bacterium]|nr:hypothetical protein [Polyangiaceae bacterium]